MEATASEFATTGDHFIVEDLLDFSNDATADDVTATANSNSSTSSAAADDVTATAISNSSLTDLPFSTDLCVPYEDLAELEWLSNFVEESFSSEDLHKLHFISGVSALKTRPEEPTEIPYYPPDPARPVISSPTPVFNPEMPVPGKARSKRSRAAPGNWASRLLLLSSGTNPARAEPVFQPPPLPKPSKKKAGHGSGSGSGFGSGHESASGEVRRCLHCATDKTPQWRTGPLGPKTLCNACGVRYKSGRLVPEYRPAASPTFVLTKHSNSHRKVMELRRQKELQKNHLQQQQLLHDPNGMIFDPPNSDDYLIHQHIGPDFRQLI